MKYLALLPLALLSACSAPRAIALRDPQTKQVVTCSADPWAVWSWDIASWNEACAQKYEHAGFARIN